jgi:hypothetical protein
MADQLAKAATRNSEIPVSFNKISKSTFYSELNEVAIRKWQTDWDKCSKGVLTEEFFPNVRERLKMKPNINPNFTAMVTGHGRTRAYRHRFRLINNTCSCNKEDQTVDHLIYWCTQQSGTWPAKKQDLIKKTPKAFPHLHKIHKFRSTVKVNIYTYYKKRVN